MSKKLGFRNLLSAVIAFGAIGPANVVSHATESGVSSSSTTDNKTLEYKAENVPDFGGVQEEVPNKVAIGERNAIKMMSDEIASELWGQNKTDPKTGRKLPERENDKLYFVDSNTKLQNFLVPLKKIISNAATKDIIGMPKVGTSNKGFVSWNYQPKKEDSYQLWNDSQALAATKTRFPILFGQLKDCVREVEKNALTMRGDFGAVNAFESYSKSLSQIHDSLSGLPNFIELELRNRIYDFFVSSTLGSSFFGSYDVTKHGDIARESMESGYKKLQKEWLRRIKGLEVRCAKRNAAIDAGEVKKPKSDTRRRPGNRPAGNSNNNRKPN